MTDPASEQAETTDNILAVLKKRYRKEMAIIDYIEMIECEIESLRHQPEPQQEGRHDPAPAPIGTCPEGAVIGEKILCRSLTFCEFQRIVDHQAMAFCFKEDAALHDIAQAEEAGRLK